MTAITEPRSGIYYGWGIGASGWGEDMDANLTSVGRFAYHLSVLDRDLSTPPASPVNGDTYIVAVGATDAWNGRDDHVAVWDGSTWVFGAPRIGWVAYVEDEEKLSAYKSSGWSLGISI